MQDEREIFERWRIGRLLGTGGMGVVHAAEHTMSGQEVALKRISRAVADQHELANRVFRETRTLARLRHSNIVQLLDCGIAASSGVYYLVMELVVGDSMRALIARAKKKRPARGLPLRLALHVMAQVAEAMVCAHELHIVHRDLKPENVMVKPGGHALVLDFGLAKNLGQARITNLPPDGVKSNPASVLGTPRYMAPEQVRGLDVDERADVYAMGIVLFESIAGCSPYQMADDTVPPTDIMCFHVFAIPTQLRELVPEAPPAVASLIARCLSKDPAARPSAYQMAVELRGHRATTFVSLMEVGLSHKEIAFFFYRSAPLMFDSLSRKPKQLCRTSWNRSRRSSYPCCRKGVPSKTIRKGSC